MIVPVSNVLAPPVLPREKASRQTDQVALEFCGDRLRALAEWRELEGRLGGARLTCSHVWTQTWLEHYGDVVPHRFAMARDADGTLQGICLLTAGVEQWDGPFRVRSLHVGTAGEPEADSVCVEYNRLLVEEGFRQAFVRALCEAVQAETGWDELRLDGFAAEDCAPFLENAEPAFRVRECVSRYFDLERARSQSQEALELLGYSTRKIVRKNLKAYGTLSGEWAEDQAAAESIFDDMVRLHQQRWNEAGRPGSYASRRFTEFHRALIARLLPEGRVILYRVRAGRELVGCVQLFVDAGRGLVYQGGSAPYTGKLSPGLVVDFLCIEECLRRGLSAYDFLAGDSLHKQRLTTDSATLCWAVQQRPRWKFRVAAAGRWVKSRWVKRQGCCRAEED